MFSYSSHHGFLFLSLVSLITPIICDSYLVLNITSPDSLVGEYLGSPAAYGHDWLNNRDEIYQFVTTQPSTACDPNTTILQSKLDIPHTLVLIARSNPSTGSNCSFVDKSRIVYETNTTYAGIVFYNVPMPGSDYSGPLVPGGSDNPSDASLPPAGMISFDLAQRILASESPVFTHIHSYTRPSFDAVFIFMLLIAVGTVFAAAWLSASKERYEMKQRILGEPIRQVIHADHIDAPVQTITQTAAIAFIFIASLGLLLMFFFINKLIWVIIVIFCIAGTQGLTAMFTLAAQAVSPLKYRKNIHIPVVGDVPFLGMICFIPAVIISIVWAIERNTNWAWGLQNLMSVGLLLLIQRTVRLPNIKIASILLCLAFVYDIFWVFLSPYFFQGESVMVRVATGGDTGESIPMLIKLPRMNDELGGYSLLGLGDIALPGLLISYLCRHDYASNISGFTLRGYFIISVIGYAIGMIITDISLLAMQQGQPALLYLVPCTLGVISLVAWYRGELSDLWNGSHEHSPEPRSQEGHTLLINDHANDQHDEIHGNREEAY